MNIELEPPADLVEYYNITGTFKSDLTVDVFSNVGEHYNVVSNIDQNIFLLKQLDEFGLLRETNMVCDCGVGLGNSLFELYLQSKEIDKEFYFSGVEKQKVYIDFMLNNLTHLWKDGVDLQNDDIMNVDYSRFNIVYSYSPFNNAFQLKSMYQKIISEISSGSIIIEHSNRGLGHFNLLEEFTELERIELDYVYVFKKL
jgi:hypothetical protein